MHLHLYTHTHTHTHTHTQEDGGRSLQLQERLHGPTDEHGFFLRADKDDQRQDQYRWYIRMAARNAPNLLRIGDTKFAMVTIETSTSAEGFLIDMSKATAANVAFSPDSQRTVCDIFPMLGVDINSYFCHFVFNTRFCKLHRQCLALIGFYAQSTGIALGNAILPDAWRFCTANVPECAALFSEFVCRCFDMMKLDHFRVFRASELESIIAQDSLVTCDNQEVAVLKMVIDWARHKSTQSCACAFGIGDEVRVKCDIYAGYYKVTAGSDHLVKAVRSAGQKLYAIVEFEYEQGKEIELEREQVHEVGASGFLRLLPLVRCAFIRPDELRTCLSDKDIAYACKFDCYREMVKIIVYRQLGKSTPGMATEQGKPRDGYAYFSLGEVGDAMVRMLTHVDKQYVCGDPEDDRTREFLMCEYVQSVIAERVDEEVRKRCETSL
jgi:hypothetical protein